MSIVEQYLAYPDRMGKKQRETLRVAISQPAVMAEFCLAVAAIIDSRHSDDPAELEDTFIFGAEVADILRQPTELEIVEASLHAAAFFYGFTGQPFSRVFEKDPVEDVLNHSTVNPDNEPAKKMPKSLKEAAIGTGRESRMMEKKWLKGIEDAEAAAVTPKMVATEPVTRPDTLGFLVTHHPIGA